MWEVLERTRRFGLNFMTNEVYHILGASIRAAKVGLGNGIIILVKKQHKGKTHTVKMLRRDNPSIVQRIPPGTERAIYEFLVYGAADVYYIEDKDKWDRQMITIGLRFMKGLTDAEKAPLKLTYYTKEQAVEPTSTSAWSWLLLNMKQYDSIFPIIDEIGLRARAIMIRAGHTEKEYIKIQNYYETHNFNERNLPTLKIHDDWYCRNPPRKLSNDEKTIIEKFPEDTQANIIKIAKVMSEDGFYEVLECLQLSAAGQYFNEVIEFTEVSKQ